MPARRKISRKFPEPRHREETWAHRAIADLESAGITSARRIEKLAFDSNAAPKLRADALKAIIVTARDRRQALIRLLSLSDDLLFIETVKVLKNARASWAAEALLEAVGHADQPRRRAALAWGLAGYPRNARARGTLLSLAGDSEPAVREHAIEALAGFRSRLVTDTLLDFLRRGTPAERYWALFSLGTQAEPGSAEAIREHLNDRTELPGLGTISEEAKWALAQLLERR